MGRRNHERAQGGARRILARTPAAARAAMRRHMNMTRNRYTKDWKEAVA